MSSYRFASTRRALSLTALGWLTMGGAAEAADCGAPEKPCDVPLGQYNVAAPPWHQGDVPRPVVVHFHGAGSSGADVVRNAALVDPIVGRGYVVIAPTGLTHPGRSGGSWSFGNRPPLRDELVFVRQALNDAVPRFHLDREHVLLTGFSVGGSLVWYLACQAPDEFAAYAPVAGGFWVPQPSSCAGPVKLLHTHGWRDQTVPLEGHPLRPSVAQSDIFAGLALWRSVNGCVGERPDTFDTDGPFWRRAWNDCTPSTTLELALHQGGHEIPEGWPTLALNWFESVVPGAD